MSSLLGPGTIETFPAWIRSAPDWTGEGHQVSLREVKYVALKQLCESKDPRFWAELQRLTNQVEEFVQLLELSVLRQRGLKRKVPRTEPGKPLRVAILGGCSLKLLSTMLGQLLDASGWDPQLFLGEFDNYPAELTGQESPLFSFHPGIVVLLPSVQRCRSAGSLIEHRDAVQREAVAQAEQLLSWCKSAHDRCGAEFVIGNFSLPARDGLGSYRVQAAASDWSFRKLVNCELGFRLPPFARICDIVFLVHQLGGLACEDLKRWFESKQPGSPIFLLALARELARVIDGMRRGPKKVLVTDLDNTLWGGVLAEDGLEGIELGRTSPRGEAYQHFQGFLQSLRERGVLLAICSKNDESVVLDALARHPEMSLRRGDFAATRINWQPKSDNLRSIAAELDLALDIFVFVDDDPAEIEIVRQFVPEVTAILLGPDPAGFAAEVQESRCFEPQSITAEDLQRTGFYRCQAQRRELLGSCTDMESYLGSLSMEATFHDVTAADAQRLAQLTRRTNQFNLTTRRRTEAELLELAGRTDVMAFSVRLRDRFGDHGLVSLLIGILVNGEVEVDTRLMSCRVLSRQVENVMLNELVGRARKRGGTGIRGLFLPSVKNQIVRELYTRRSVSLTLDTPDRREWVLETNSYSPRESPIHISFEP